jgi:hypothetical protein
MSWFGVAHHDILFFPIRQQSPAHTRRNFVLPQLFTFYFILSTMSHQRKGFPHCRMVEIQIPPAPTGGVSTVPILDQPDLRYARVLAMEIFCYPELQATFPSNYRTILGNEMSQIALVLETNDADDIAYETINPKTGAKEMHLPRQAMGNGRFSSTQQNVKYLPLASLHRVQNASNVQPGTGPDPFVRQLMEFDNLYVTWDKSFLQISNGGILNRNPVGVALMVYYSWLDINGKPIVRN